MQSKSSIILAVAVLAKFAAADFGIFQIIEHGFYSSDGHTHTENFPGGFTPAAYTGAVGTTCPDAVTGTQSATDGQEQDQFGPGYTLYFENGFCGSPAPYQCVGQDDGTAQCYGPDAGLSLHVNCVPFNAPTINPYYNCNEVGGPLDLNSEQWFLRYNCSSSTINC